MCAGDFRDGTASATCDALPVADDMLVPATVDRYRTFGPPRSHSAKEIGLIWVEQSHGIPIDLGPGRGLRVGHFGTSATANPASGVAFKAPRVLSVQVPAGPVQLSSPDPQAEAIGWVPRVAEARESLKAPRTPAQEVPVPVDDHTQH